LLLSRNIVVFSYFLRYALLASCQLLLRYNDRSICERSQYVFICFSPSNLRKFSLARTTLTAVK